MDHYLADLRAMPITTEMRSHPDAGVSDASHKDYMSLAGGIGWLAQFRYDAAVYIGSLQRATQKPTNDHCIRLNRLLKWLKRTKAPIVYKPLTGHLRIMAVTDSAFKRTDNTGLACRGHLVMLMSMTNHKNGDPISPDGQCHIFDGISRRQRRVSRSTYAAEINGAADTLEPAKLVAMIYTEILCGVQTGLQQKERMMTGNWPIHIELAIDAKSVFDSIVVRDVKIPSEQSLIAILLSIREQITYGLIKYVWWVDTLDMVADALTKGIVPRNEILVLMRTGAWLLKKRFVRHSVAAPRP
jgi:hypothetical protein